MPLVYRSFRVLGLLLVCSCLIGTASAQIQDNQGREFYIGFMPNFDAIAGMTTELHLTADQATTVTVEYPAVSPTFMTTVNLTPGAITIVDLGSAPAFGWTAGAVGDNAVRAFGPEEFVAYAINRRSQSTDAALALPVDVLNNEYILQSFVQSFTGLFTVVAAFDGTQVTVTPSVDLTGGFSAGTPFTITLDRGEGFLGQSVNSGPTGDISGTIVESSLPVAVSNGARCTILLASACDHLFEVAQPTQSWGQDALAAPLPQRSGAPYRIMAAVDGTVVSQNGTVVANLDRGQFFETPVSAGPQSFSATERVFVTQYMTGQLAAGATSGDPAMGNVIPTEQYLQSYTFSTIGGNQFAQNFVAVIAEDADVAGGTILLDGSPIPAGSFTPIAGTGFQSAVIPILEGTHTTSSSGFHGINVIGINSFDSYIYPGGAKFEFINPITDTNPPDCGGSYANDVFNGTVSDNDDGDDTGIAFVGLVPGSTNLTLSVDPFVPGDPVVTYTVSLTDPTMSGSGTVRVSDGEGNTCQQPIQITVGGGALACAQAVPDLVPLGFATTGDEYADFENAGSQTIDLASCAFASWNPFTERVRTSIDLAGTLAPGAVLRVGEASAPDVDVVVGSDPLFDGPGAFSIHGVDASTIPPGSSVGPAVPSVVASLVYLQDGTVFGRYPAGSPAKASGGDLAAMLRAAAEAGEEVPGAFALEAAYPNPFNPATTIAYTLAQPADVRLAIYDALGRQVRTLVASAQEAGTYEVRWDGRDASGQAVASGVYLYKLEAGPHTAARTMLLAK